MGRDGRRGKAVGEGAALGALDVQGGFGALGTRDRGAGELAGGFGLCLAGGLQCRELAGGLLPGPGEGVLAALAGLGQRGGGTLGVLPGGSDCGVALAGGPIQRGGCLRGLALGGRGAGEGGGELPGQAIGLLFRLLDGAQDSDDLGVVAALGMPMGVGG
jgi:hypothetical protein